ncbi:hypothetical protein, partial [uncultured Kluyvera sp.]|uniref:hypothetical protein n=1 Tax=uncultured Kluyvera sp. TaxID=286549 RepID=UPI0028064F53
AENTDDLFVGKTLLHGDVLMWLMKTLLTSGCTNQRGAGHQRKPYPTAMVDKVEDAVEFSDQHGHKEASNQDIALAHVGLLTCSDEVNQDDKEED